MGKSQRGISVDFNGITELQQTLANLGSEAYTKAVVNALGASKDYVNAEILKAMEQSPYNFDNTGYSQLKTQKGLSKVEQMDVEVRGTEAVAYAGVSYHEAPELWYLAHGGQGNPHAPKEDPNLYNAVRVKGKVKQEVQRIQQEEFTKVIEEALRNG